VQCIQSRSNPLFIFFTIPIIFDLSEFSAYQRLAALSFQLTQRTARDR